MTIPERAATAFWIWSSNALAGNWHTGFGFQFFVGRLMAWADQVDRGERNRRALLKRDIIPGNRARTETTRSIRSTVVSKCGEEGTPPHHPAHRALQQRQPMAIDSRSQQGILPLKTAQVATGRQAPVDLNRARNEASIASLVPRLGRVLVQQPGPAPD